jgi:hypothetical protein|tara:strand:- start:357 stop:698 length:342 start_codon:yes stop_codon:yes gene_type:complete
MAQLSTKVKLYIEANSKTWDNTKVSLQNDGSGDYIKTWTYSFSKPTNSQIASYETAGNTAESNAAIDVKRRTEYLSWQEQLDKLYHDINDGKLNKTGSWYKHIKAVKDANSKG